MPSTGLYFLPLTSTEGSPLRDFLARLTATYKVSPLPQWTLEHRIFRETPNAATSDRTTVKYLQILTLSHEPGASYIAITNTHNNTATNTTPSLSSQQQQQAQRVGRTDASNTDSSSSSINGRGEAAATISSIASGQATDEFVQFLVNKLAPLWTVSKMASVVNGLSFEVGDFRIRVGELRQGIGSSLVLRGIIVEVNWAGDGGGGGGGGGGAGEGGGHSDGMEEESEGVIKGFWEPLGVKEWKEVFQVAGFADGNGTVRQWFEMLRLRG